jgi:hypothetical protein
VNRVEEAFGGSHAPQPGYSFDSDVAKTRASIDFLAG